jgi:hypothetical protein
MENELLCAHCNQLLTEADRFSCCNSCAAKGCCRQERTRAEHVSFWTEHRAKKAQADAVEADSWPSTQGLRNFDQIGSWSVSGQTSEQRSQATYATALVELIARTHDDRELETDRKQAWEWARQRQASLDQLKSQDDRIE